MSLAAGTVLGAYEITSLLGRGGMGEVYRARDTNLQPRCRDQDPSPEFSSDAERVGRFQREAQALAALNHPHIAAIHDLQEASNTRFLILELVEGETFAERLQRGRLPLDEALQIARQLCEALEAAHERGIIHRDVKPSNIKLTPSGQVEGPGFRFGEGAQQPDGDGSLEFSDSHEQFDSRDHSGDCRVHEPRAGARQNRGSAGGCLVVRLRPV